MAQKSVTIQTTIDEPADLRPLKCVLHGPPASGKTRLAKRLCQRYGAYYVSVKSMIEDTLATLRENIEREQERIQMKVDMGEKAGEGDEEGEEDEGEVGDEEEEEVAAGGAIEEWQEQIRDITELISKSENEKLPDDYVVRLMRSFLLSEVCQSRGYVLDGFPKTILQAKELFGQAAEGAKMDEGGKPADVPEEGGMPGEGDEKVGGMLGNASVQIMPDFVVSLLADDNFLCQRVMKLPEREIRGTHFDEFNMLRRLAEFRANNTEENTILKFFDESGIHPILIDLVDKDTEEEKDIESIFAYIGDVFGEPIPGFGLTLEEIEELRRLEMEERRLLEQADRLEKRLKEEKATKEYQDKMERWAEILQQLQMEEEKLLAAQSEPLRFYLMKYVFPTLSQGLVEVAKIKPDDPVDFLAEFLFQQNPEGKMFDPSYSRDGEQLLDQYEEEIGPKNKYCKEGKFII